MKILITQLLLHLFLCTYYVSASDYTDEGTGLVFANEIAGYTLSRETEKGDPKEKFDDPRLGYSISYTSATSEVTIYVFTGGAEGIQEGVSGKWVNYFFEQAIEEVKLYEDRGYYKGVQKRPLADEFSKVCPVFFLGTELTYTVTMKGPKQKVKSYVFCRGVQKQIFKIRATGSHDSDFEESLAKFLKSLADQF